VVIKKSKEGCRKLISFALLSIISVAMKKTLLFPGAYYHIFNHAVGRDNLFLNSGNYEYFLQKYALHIPQVADTFVYCLLPNHLHLVVRIKPVDELVYFFTGNQPLDEEEQEVTPVEISLEELQFRVSKQFGNLFSAYTQAFNIQQKRKGNLFTSNFKRKEINSPEYFFQAVLYVISMPFIMISLPGRRIGHFLPLPV
jgi:hypothetical protein